jgi:integrase
MGTGSRSHRMAVERVVEPSWPRLPTESCFRPHYLSESDVLKLLALCAGLKRPDFRASLYRALVLVLYCTGIPFGEALRLRMRDVDTRPGVLCVETFKGRPDGFLFIARYPVNWIGTATLTASSAGASRPVATPRRCLLRRTASHIPMRSSRPARVRAPHGTLCWARISSRRSPSSQ